MHTELLIGERLKDLRVLQHLTLEQLAEKTGISKSALGNYESDDCDSISPSCLRILAGFYQVSADYLLGLTEQKNHSDASVEGLHLSDSVIELLHSGKINHRLLCELLVHAEFPQLLADLEIYVDGIANMQIQNLNAYVDAARNEIVRRYNPGDEDHVLQTLSAAHIDENRYFAQLLDGDIERIAVDLRTAHAKDSDTASENSTVQEFQKALQEAESFKGSPQEKMAKLYCREIGIDYKKLTPEEFRILVGILEKSKYTIKAKKRSTGNRRHRKR